jgi:hypothetical protein
MLEIISTLEDRYKFLKSMSLEENYQQYVTDTTGNLKERKNLIEELPSDVLWIMQYPKS